jgi:hypothetical protein
MTTVSTARSPAALTQTGGDGAPRRRGNASLFVIAMLSSAVLHATLLLIGSVIYLTNLKIEDAPAGQGVGAAISVATITEAELGALERGMLDTAGPAVDEAATSAGMLQSLPGVESPGGQATPGSGDLGGVGAGMGGAGAGDGIGIGDGSGGSGGGGTKFFGVEARGMRFAYIVDVSGSMEGEKIAYLRDQLATSINGIIDTGSYFVVAFSTDVMPLHPAIRWMDASTKNKRESGALINRLRAGGGTEPGGAFQMVFGMRPKPDAIYFMTDGQFDAGVAETIARVNKGAARVPVHCISLIDDSSADLMRRIARDSGGTYTHIKGTGRP